MSTSRSRSMPRGGFEIVPDLGDETCQYGPGGMLLVRTGNVLAKITTAKDPKPQKVARLVVKCVADLKQG